MPISSESSTNVMSVSESTIPVQDRRNILRSDFSICLMIILGGVLVVPALMMSPWAYLTAFPPPPPKTESQLIAEKAEEHGIVFDTQGYKRGKALFMTTCVACHTPEGGSRPNLGKDIVHSSFTADQTDKELMTFLKMGRNPGDPLNTTGVGMPPKGGNPTLMDKDLADLITFIRGLQVMEDVSFK